MAGCAQAPPPVSDKVANYYEQHKTLQPIATSSATTAVFIGDSFIAGNDETPGAAKYGFVDQASDSLGWEKVNLAQGGTGYINPGANGSTPYSGVVDRAVSMSPKVVIVGGGINDATSAPADITSAADALYKDLKAKLPQATLIVIGPVAPGLDEGQQRNAIPVRDALKVAAARNSLPFIDPVAEDWMPTKGGLVGPTNFHPNAAGYKLLADKLVPHLKELVPAS